MQTDLTSFFGGLKNGGLTKLSAQCILGGSASLMYLVNIVIRSTSFGDSARCLVTNSYRVGLQ